MSDIAVTTKEERLADLADSRDAIAQVSDAELFGAAVADEQGKGTEIKDQEQGKDGAADKSVSADGDDRERDERGRFVANDAAKPAQTMRTYMRNMEAGERHLGMAQTGR